MDLKSVRNAVSRVQNGLFKKSNSYSIGVLKGQFRGSGLKFKEHQVYHHGDDVRFIDWKITAKTNTPYVKTFEEDRNVEITIVLDCGPSMLIGHKGVSKLQAAIEISCLMYLLAKETQDFVRVIIMGERLVDLPKMRGEKGITALISELEKQKIVLPNGKINIERFSKHSKDEQKKRLRFLKSHIAKKREVICLTDFQTFISEDEVNKIARYKRVHLFKIQSPLEVSANEKVTLFGNAQTGGGVFTFLSRKKAQEKLPKWMKEIDVSRPYLEDFIKGMKVGVA